MLRGKRQQGGSWNECEEDVTVVWKSSSRDAPGIMVEGEEEDNRSTGKMEAELAEHV